MIAPTPQQDFAASLKQRRNDETPPTSSVGATFRSTGAQHDGLPTGGSLSPVTAPLQQPVAGIGKQMTGQNIEDMEADGGTVYMM